MTRVKNFNKWFTEDIQEWLTWYKQLPDGDISTRFRLRYNTLEVYVRLPRERHSYWISLNNLCKTLDWRIEMEPGDIERLREFITAEAKPLLDARDAEKAKRQQQSEHAKQQAQDTTAYVAELEAEVARLQACIAVVEAERDRMREELEYQEYEDQIETLQYIVDHSDGAGEVVSDSEGFWLDCPDEEEDTTSIFLGTDFDEAHKVLEERREAYIDDYWGDTLFQK